MIYPAFGPAKEFSPGWIFHILARNLLATWIICGFWDWFLYFSPLQQKLHKYKMNPVYPSFSQIKHDALVTTSASVAAAGIEIYLCHLWATGRLPLPNLSDAPLMNLMMALLLTHYRIPHFHLTSESSSIGRCTACTTSPITQLPSLAPTCTLLSQPFTTVQHLFLWP